MENIEIDVKDNKLIIVIDLSKKGTLSKSGKSSVIASTHGNHTVSGTDFKLGLNLYKSASL